MYNRYNVAATVNYPETEVQTPDYKSISNAGVMDFVSKLLMTEPEATSFTIIVTVKQENK